jgi:hypothetical protein
VSIPTLLHVLNNSKAKKSHRLVLIEIANHVNDDNGLAWPTYQTIANKTGLTRRRVIDLVAELNALGEIEILPHGSPMGGQAYRVRRSETISLTAHLSSEKKDKKGVKLFHPESYIDESIFRKKSGGEGNREEEGEQRPLTRAEALSIGLTPGSRLFLLVTGESDE